ncbi:NTP pyrophosphohydrolase, partial [Streptomyces sp. NPDC059564]
LGVAGAARGVVTAPGVGGDAAPARGHDRIVELVAAAAGRSCVVVTADRELRARVRAYGAECVGPRTVRPAG